MKSDFVAKHSIMVDAPALKVWDALINPVKIKRYLFGTDAVSDWREGSPITYSGEWQGKKYEDKGRVRKVVPGKLLESTYWSSMSGRADLPENYCAVTYTLESKNNGTMLTVIQDNNATEEARKHCEQNWKMVLEGLKKVVEEE